ncbi:MAG TPA: hypothetical protein VF541_06330 [Longimicrobium sp.]
MEPGVAPPLAPPAEQGRSDAAAPARQQTPPQSKRFPDGRALLGAFLQRNLGGGGPLTDSAAAAGARGQGAPAGKEECIPPVGVMIATLPDPRDSHLDWAFDSDFEAILRAYERAGYVIDRYWLPWSETSDTMLPAVGTSPGRRLRDTYPGVVLFRRDAGSGGDPTACAGSAVAAADSAAADSSAAAADAGTPGDGRTDTLPDLQLLYIVGEVPTGGVSKDALQRALKERDEILARARRREPLRLVGPSFSGSGTSLGVALRAWRRGHDEPVEIITGTSASAQTSAGFGDLEGVSFSSAVHSDEALTEALVWSVLCPLGLGDDRVAILRESGSAYGREAVRSDEGGWLACPDGRRLRPYRFMVIPFPMNIGSVRAEFEANAADAARARGTQPQSRARLVLRDPERPGDRPPPASQLTVPTLEVVLDEIERAITSHRIRAVGIIASDVRDKLFLAMELSRRMRDVQLFTFEGNALYLVPENNAALRGMLVLSTYPLNVQTQWWTRGYLGGMRLSFPNEGALGIHNAVLMQLGADSLAVNYGSPFVDLTGGRPPVWISAVGRNEFLPVTVLPARDDPAMREANSAGGARATEWPVIHFFTALAILLLGGVLLYGARRMLPGSPPAAVPPVARPEHTVGLGAVVLTLAGLRRRRPRAEPEPAYEDVLAELQRGTQHFHSYAYQALRALALFSVFLPVAAITGFATASKPLLRGPGVGSRILALLWLVAVVVLGGWAVVRFLGASRRRLRELWPLGAWFTVHEWPHRDARWWRAEVVLRTLVLAGGFSFFVLSAWFTLQVWKMWDGRPITFPLFVTRAARLDSGVSPLLPLLLGGAGYAAWCTWHTLRIQLLRETTPFEEAWDAPGRPAGPTALPRGAEGAVREIRMRLFRVLPDRGGRVMLAVVVAIGVVLGSQVGHTIEGMIGLTAFDWLLALSVSGSLVSTCWAVYRLLSVWGRLDCVLRNVAETPLLPAFRRLPQAVAQLTRLTLWAPPSREVIETVSAAQWRHLQQIRKNRDSAFQKLDTPTLKVSALVDAYMAAPNPPSSRVPLPAIGARHDHSFVTLNGILSVLWAAEPDEKVVESIQEEVKKSPHESTSALFRRSFPTEVRLWLRAAEEFAAVQVVDYLEWVLQQLRTLTVFLFVSLLLTTALLSSYPFQPQSLAKLVFLFVLLVTVSVLLYVMAALNRDAVLSLIAGTDPGRLSLDRSFIINALAVGVVPLLTLISSELPDWHLFAFLDPVIHALTGGG